MLRGSFAILLVGTVQLHKWTMQSSSNNWIMYGNNLMDANAPFYMAYSRKALYWKWWIFFKLIFYVLLSHFCDFFHDKWIGKKGKHKTMMAFSVYVSNSTGRCFASVLEMLLWKKTTQSVNLKPKASWNNPCSVAEQTLTLVTLTEPWPQRGRFAS